KLGDGTLLDYEIRGTQSNTAQRLILGATDAQDSWVPAGTVPVNLTKGLEIGPGVLLPDGRVFWIGATSNTAIYTPPTTLTGTGGWETGQMIIDNLGNTLGGSDAPAAVLPDGNVLFAASTFDGANYGTTTVFEYDPNTNSINQVTATGPALSSVNPFQ